MKFDFSGKAVLLTGAASGIALLAAKEFAAMYANVVLIDINEEKLIEVTQQIDQIYPKKAAYAVCDVRQYMQVEDAVKKAADTFGSIDVMINLAGGAECRILGVDTKKMEFPDIPIDIYDWSLDVNLRGQLYFDHAVMKYMREQRTGVIINIGSVTGEEGCYSDMGYSAAKSGAAHGLTKACAMYGAQYGIRVVSLCPGPVLTRQGMNGMKTLLKRAAQPQEMVNMLVFLASDNASFATGSSFLVDGGRMLTWDRTWD